MALFAPQYCLDTKLIYRSGFAVSTAALWATCSVVRYYIYDDNVAKVDPLTLDMLPYVIMSFFPDYSLRSAFRTEMQLQQLERLARSRGAAMV